MFEMLKKAVTGNIKSLNGRKDLLEACCAAAALIAAADGEIEPEEVSAIVDRIKANEKLGTSFSVAEIEACAEKMLQKASKSGGFTGKAALRKEIEETRARGDAEDCTTVVLIALDIAMADGEIEPQEMVVLRKLAADLGVNLQKLME